MLAKCATTVPAMIEAVFPALAGPKIPAPVTTAGRPPKRTHFVDTAPNTQGIAIRQHPLTQSPVRAAELTTHAITPPSTIATCPANSIPMSALALSGMFLSGCDGVESITQLVFVGLSLMSLGYASGRGYQAISSALQKHNLVGKYWVEKLETEEMKSYALSRGLAIEALSNVVVAGCLLNIGTEWLFSTHNPLTGLASCLVALGAVYVMRKNNVVRTSPEALEEKRAQIIAELQKGFLNETLSSGLNPRLFAEDPFFRECLRYFFSSTEYGRVPHLNTSPFVSSHLAPLQVYADQQDLFMAFAEFMVIKLRHNWVPIENRRRIAQGLCDYLEHICPHCPDGLLWRVLPLLSDSDLPMRHSLTRFFELGLARMTPLQRQIHIQKLTTEIKGATYHDEDNEGSDYLRSLAMVLAASWDVMNDDQRKPLLRKFVRYIDVRRLGRELRMIAEKISPEDDGISVYSNESLTAYLSAYLGTSDTLPTAKTLRTYCDNIDPTNPNKLTDALVAFEVNTLGLPLQRKQELTSLLQALALTGDPTLQTFCGKAIEILKAKNASASSSQTTTEPSSKARSAQAQAKTTS
ncbi:MAG: hypothetical protein ACD_62C00043G0007 [uncultured bacterium]|nr:MAG: hypothetical protein ACD_62C00043G0007 [uncultured bacterium]HLD44551.1 hypothetical protein [bacterium]